MPSVMIVINQKNTDIIQFSQIHMRGILHVRDLRMCTKEDALQEMPDKQSSDLELYEQEDDSSLDAALRSSDVFVNRLAKFVEKKKATLFNAVDLKHCSASNGIYFHDSLDMLSTENYTTVPPIEIFMDVPKTSQIVHFYKSIERGMVITGVIFSLVDTGFYMNLIGVDVGQARNVAEWKLTAFCPAREMSAPCSHEDPLDMFVVKDKVRAVVVKVNEEKITVSLQSHHLPNAYADVKLGIVTDEEVSLYYSRSEECQGKTYEDMLKGSSEYENPSNIANLALMFGLCNLDSRPSLMDGLHNVRYSKKDCAEYLRKCQSHRLAMINVKEALVYFKENKHVEAMQMANKALEIDEDNVEALVIRGALYANFESYKRAIEDFENALTLDSAHHNALKYLLQVLTAHSRNLINEDHLSPARKFLTRALELNEQHADKNISKSIDDLLQDLRKKKRQADSDVRDREKRLEINSPKKSHSKRDRRKSSSSQHNVPLHLRYYSPVYDDDAEVYGPELPPDLHKNWGNDRKRRARSSDSDASGSRGAKKTMESLSKKRKVERESRRSDSSSPSSSSSSSTSLSSLSSSSSSPSSSSSQSSHKKTLKRRSPRRRSKSRKLETKSQKKEKHSPAREASYRFERTKHLLRSPLKEDGSSRLMRNMVDSHQNLLALAGGHDGQRKEAQGSGNKEKMTPPQERSFAKSAILKQNNPDNSRPGETLEEMEMFLKELKNKQKVKKI